MNDKTLHDELIAQAAKSFEARLGMNIGVLRSTQWHCVERMQYDDCGPREREAITELNSMLESMCMQLNTKLGHIECMREKDNA